MKPMMILPPKTMSDADIQTLRDNGLCVVVADDPGKVRFMDPLPAVSSRTAIENAALGLSRKLLNGDLHGGWRGDFAKTFVDLLIEGTPLDPAGTREEQEQRIIDDARADELRKIGREEARAARAAKKAQKSRSDAQ